MKPDEIHAQLDGITEEKNLIVRLQGLVDSWTVSGANLSAVEPILVFMEKNRDWDFGMPGPLVHFVEKFYRSGYEQKLVESIRRSPTPHTVWMLNRLINGEKDLANKRFYLDLLSQARSNSSIDEVTRNEIDRFLGIHIG